jgi:type IV pilus assembly protein PilB
MTDEELAQGLMEEGVISLEQLQTAQGDAEKRKVPLERVILDSGLATKEDIYGLVADRWGSLYVDLGTYLPQKEALELIPEETARRYNILPLFKLNETLTIATSDPSDLMLLDQLGLKTGTAVECLYSPIHEIQQALDAFYGRRDVAQELIEKMGRATRVEAGGVLEEIAAESPIAKLVDLIITQAARDRASDIHIEPEEKLLRIRFRIDGLLHEIPSPPKHLEPAIISRIKVLAGMDIAESRAPQDGHFQVEVDSRTVDLRVSTLPTVNGENVVMRLLDTGSVLIGLEKLGFTKESLERYEEAILRPYGVILSTGPTGSGKTTTLYSALTRINSIERNIVTIEDPVEYRLGLIRQVQVNPKAGITFANGLRSIVRQDPDVIMVGEIRDLETAVIAIQSALTGHLVFSTLHTNDAPSAVTRLENMGVEPFLISAALTAIMAQRLVRTICPACKESYEPNKAIIKRWGLSEEAKQKKLLLYRGKGCSECKGTGYKGRTGIFELMVINDEIREMIIQGASIVALRKEAQKGGMKLLREDGLEKALEGITTLEEVSRVTEEKVEVKPPEEAPIELKRVAEPREELPAKVPEAIVPIKTRDVEEYEKKIVGWLAKKR